MAIFNNCKVSISSKGVTTSNMQKHLATQHAIPLQECRVFDTLLTSDASESSSSGAIGRPSVINAKCVCIYIDIITALYYNCGSLKGMNT